MASLDKINILGEKIGSCEIPEDLQSFPCSEHLVHASILAQLANRRQGTACTKTKGEVKCSGAKPWRQKGTGRARAGYASSPIWRGGGVVFGPKPRSYAQKTNRKSRRKAMFGVIASKIRDGRVRAIEDWAIDAPKTKIFVGLKETLEVRKLLCIGLVENKNAYLSARNITNVQFLDIDSINVYDLVNATDLVISEAALKVIEERFQSVKQFARKQ